MSDISLYLRGRKLLVAGVSAAAVFSFGACSSAEPESETVAPTTSTVAPASPETEEVSWGYEGEGAPENWGDLEPEFETCGTGTEQSPIDLVSADPVDLPDLTFDYTPSTWTVVNNGHTVQVTPDQEHVMELDERDNTLLQMHVHTPSEHLVGGEDFDVEAHFVHSDSDDELTVVGVLFEEGAANPIIDQMLAEVPATVDEEAAVQEEIDLTEALPESREYNTYAGSLTTPPCSEDVTWIVYTQPISASAEQISDLEALVGPNARPVQDLNDRDIEDDATVG